ncbi:MAG: transketolase family protein [Bacillota bacterium]|nr:transketolase family protein [Bacillota bacterium]
MFEWKLSRDGFGEGMIELGQADPRVVVLGADLSDSTRALWFKEKFPDRFFSFGIAEQNMLGAAGGLSLAGKIPFVCTYGVFLSGRAWDQIRTTICYSNLNVKMGGAHGGISVGPDGATHQALEDCALIRVLPNMTLVVPCDYYETKKATIAVGKMFGPAYVRFGREKTPVITAPDTPFELGKAAVFREGSDISLIANGYMVSQCLLAADELAKEGISARVINLHTLKPLDREAIVKAAQETGAIVTAEEHQLIGGLGAAVAEVVAEECPVPMAMIGIRDQFGESGSPEELLKLHGLTAGNVAQTARKLLARKKGR